MKLNAIKIQSLVFSWSIHCEIYSMIKKLKSNETDLYCTFQAIDQRKKFFFEQQTGNLENFEFVCSFLYSIENAKEKIDMFE